MRFYSSFLFCLLLLLHSSLDPTFTPPLLPPPTFPTLVYHSNPLPALDPPLPPPPLPSNHLSCFELRKLPELIKGIL